MIPRMHTTPAVSVPQWLRALLVVVIGFCFLAPVGEADARRKRKRKRRTKRKPPATKPAPKPAPAATPDSGAAAPTSSPKDKRRRKNSKPKSFDFTGLNIGGRLRTPQLLYFLDRASQELKRASLERRSFIPEMVKSLDEESL